MKTFEEAALLVIQRVDGKQIEQAKEQVMATAARYREIGEQVACSTELAALTTLLASEMVEGRLNWESAVYTVFMHGLQIGIEMEKAE